MHHKLLEWKLLEWSRKDLCSHRHDTCHCRLDTSNLDFGFWDGPTFLTQSSELCLDSGKSLSDHRSFVSHSETDCVVCSFTRCETTWLHVTSGHAVMCTSLTVNSTRCLSKIGVTPTAADATGTLTCHVGHDFLEHVRCVEGRHVVSVVDVLPMLHCAAFAFSISTSVKPCNSKLDFVLFELPWALYLKLLQLVRKSGLTWVHSTWSCNSDLVPRTRLLSCPSVGAIARLHSH